MRLTNKVLIWSWLFFLLVFGALVYGAYSKLKPASLVSLLNEQIRISYPGSNLMIGDIDYGFSIDFSLRLSQLTIEHNKKTIARAKEVQLVIPWWLILFNRGNAHLNITSLDIFVSPGVSDSMNNSKSVITKINPNIQVNLPKYLLDAHYTLRAKDVSVKELNTDRRLFTLSKLLIREFQYGKNSAFELNIPISITRNKKKISSNLWLFGDLTPEIKTWTLNYRGEFKTKDTFDNFQFDDLVIHGKSIFNPHQVDLVSTIDLLIDRKNIGTGKINARYDELLLFVKVDEFPLDFLTIFGEEIKNPFWSKLEGDAQGEIRFQRNFGKNTSSLSAKLHFPGDFILGTDSKVAGKWQLSFENEKWETSFFTPNGEISFFRRTVLDFDKNKISQYSQEIGFNGFNLKEAMLTVDPLSKTLNSKSEQYYSTFISLKKCLDGDRVIDGSIRYGSTPFQTFYLVQLKEGQSALNLDYLNKSANQQIKIDFTDFFWHSSYHFFDPFFYSAEGTIDGSIEGKWSQHWSSGKWLFNFKAQGLKNLEGEFMDLNHNLWSYFNIDPLIFENQKWKGSIVNSAIKLSAVTLEGKDISLISGSLTTTPKLKSYLTLTHPKNKKWKPVKKEVTEVFWKKENP